MDFKLFGDYITLQALLKDLGIIPSGGAIKSYLAQTEVFFNGQAENRRGKKLRVGDVIEIPSQAIKIAIVQPTDSEKAQHEEDLAEKARVAKLVKKLNQKEKGKSGPKAKQKPQRPVRFPGS